MQPITMITGATSGIGRATARVLAQDGHHLILTGRRRERLNALRDELSCDYPNGRFLTLAFDVRSREAVEEAITNLPTEWQAIGTLINNAGLAVGLEPLHEGNPDDWERMIDTNIKGLLYVTRAVAPGMAARRAGHIVNLGSIAGREVYPGGAVYCATKHAVRALSQGMRQDLLPYGIRVSLICPGAVETEFSLVRFKGDNQRAASVYDGYTPLTADDIARTIRFALNAPAHVDLQDILVMPTAQADSRTFHRG
ncbi:NAD(P)-dependent oxidoreductase [Tannerella sp. oral taxon 808]|nr:NAD(P)-dependent oxidoreductase [Tannerella sp. oral taxon 808]